MNLFLFIDSALTHTNSIKKTLDHYTSMLEHFSYYSHHNENLETHGIKLDKPLPEYNGTLIIGDDITVSEFYKLGIKSNIVKHKSVNITRVINVKTSDIKDFVYIGRGTKWGNPHTHLTGELTREEAINAFEYDFHNNLFLNINMKDHIGELKGCVLGCSCKPLDCHGDTLAKAANALPFD